MYVILLFCLFILNAVDGIFRCSAPAFSEHIDDEDNEKGEQQRQEHHLNVKAGDTTHHRR